MLVHRLKDLNDMSVLLRSGDIKDYMALGQDGQAVYMVANQLRDAIRLKRGRMMADYLALPQRNDIGSSVDWYIPFATQNENGEYSIIPWTSATPEEKAEALAKLDVFKASMFDLGQDLASSTKGDQLLFSRLLYIPNSLPKEQLKALRFPSEQHVYLVDGRPVITFWGFADKNQLPYDDPFFVLRPEEQPAEPIAYTSPLNSPLPETGTIEVSSKSHHLCFQWWILLPTLLLTLLLLWWLLNPYLFNTFGIQFPLTTNSPKAELTEPSKVEPEIPHFIDGRWVDKNGVEITDPALLATLNRHSGITGNGAEATPTALPKGQSDIQEQPLSGGAEPKANNNAESLNPAAESEAATSNISSEPATMDSEVTEPIANTSGDTIPEIDNSSTPNNEAISNQSMTPNLAATPSKNLSMTPNMLANGKTDFLNGHWSAGAGIQDKSTGKPLKLSYQFNNGKGQVTLKRGDGVSCTADVNASIQKGGLAINNNGTASCSDGSTYQLPSVSCKPTANGEADCKGNYNGGHSFPMSMKSI